MKNDNETLDTQAELRKLSRNENLKKYFDSENKKIIKKAEDFSDYEMFFHADGTKKKNPYESQDWINNDAISVAFSDWNDRFVDIKLFLMEEDEFVKWALKLIKLKNKMSY